MWPSQRVPEDGYYVADGHDGGRLTGPRAGASTSGGVEAVLSLRSALGLASLVSAVSALAGGLLVAALLQPGPAGTSSAASSSTELFEELGPATLATARQTEHLFAELSVDEVRSVAAFAAEQLGCSSRFPESFGGCFLSGSEAVTLQLPSKEAALAYLDAGQAAPARMAQVIVVHAEKPPESGVRFYTVGPLTGQGGLEEGASVTHTGSVHFNRRPVDMADGSCDVVSHRVFREMKDILLSSFGDIFPTLSEAKDPKDGSIWIIYAPAGTSTVHKRVSRAQINYYNDPEQFQVSWMHPLPFNFVVVQDGLPQQWYAENLTYCGQSFRSLAGLLAADAAGSLARCSARPSTDYSWDTPGPDPGSAARDSHPQAPRRVLQTWQVLGRGAVRWGDWEFQATVRPGSGLAIHDVRWRGERILYELALSDAHAYYAAKSPEEQWYYSDKAFSLSQLSADLVLGLDCPVGATVLESSHWVFFALDGTVSSDPAQAQALRHACVYESDGLEGSSWRHAQLLNRRVTGRRTRMLVTRAVSTVGNYDYISEVHFGEDGSIHVRNEFAGFPETDKIGPFRDEEHGRRIGRETVGASSASPDFGNRVHHNVVAQLHSHFVVWKVDLDVLGQRNEFRILKSVVHSSGASGPEHKAQEEHRVEREDQSPLVASASSPGVWAIVNPEERNAVTGAPRGYAIMIQSAPAVQTLPPGHPFSVAGSFARRHLAVTKRKEEEPQAVHSLDHFAVTEPLLSVDNFLADGESLVGEDLVCWVSVGKEHFTRTEDVPLVSNFGVQFAIVPWNYHVENPAMELPMVVGPAPRKT
ncbi:unnamed protein product [Polarella glacialis]|uniref:Amine oxidase n=1 Tax=Polarella glacialis TaxID=89957 RepID=A0A813DXL1_POLGL|nr:unnamed protein product [Polarella glacialis]